VGLAKPNKTAELRTAKRKDDFKCMTFSRNKNRTFNQEKTYSKLTSKWFGYVIQNFMHG
jgi:hypothetical protein